MAPHMLFHANYAKALCVPISKASRDRLFLGLELVAPALLLEVVARFVLPASYA